MNKTEIQILKAIKALEPKAYSVSIAEHIERENGKILNAGTLFISLSNLEKQNFISSEKNLKLYYFLTILGQRKIN